MINEVMRFVVRVAPDVAYDYLSDFTHAEEWDPGTVRCVRLDEGPIRVGSAWRNESRLVFVPATLRFELTEKAPGRLVFTGVNDKSTSVDEITIADAPDGSLIRYSSTVTLRGPARIATPLFRVLLRRMAAELPAQMTATLEALPHAAGRPS